MRRNRHLGIAAVGAAVLLLGVGAPATAGWVSKACTNELHCYGRVLTRPSGMTALGATVNPSCLTAVKASAVTDEIWLAGADLYWVEVGFVNKTVRSQDQWNPQRPQRILGRPASNRRAFTEALQRACTRPQAGDEGPQLVDNPAGHDKVPGLLRRGSGLLH